MTSEITLVRAGTMLLADAAGDVLATAGSAQGLYLDDVRHLSTWRLVLSTTEGSVPFRVAGTMTDASLATTALVPPAARNEPTEVLLAREQEVRRDGLHERWRITRTAPGGSSALRLRLEAGADFADQFAVRSDGRIFATTTSTSTRTRADGADLDGAVTAGDTTLRHTTSITASPVPDRVHTGDGVTLEWDLRLDAGESVTVELRASATHRRVGASERADSAGPSGQGVAARALGDLDALVMPCPGAEDLSIPAAGAPWFLTLFGRDSILASLLAGEARPGLLPDVVRALARTQATTDEPERLAQTGKIVHEVRVGDLARLDLVPYSRYYGTVDATALFLVALGALDPEDARDEQLEAAARAAVGWLRGPGGLDAGGFVTYVPDPGGLINQGWKDSHDAVAFRDGTLATGPIALCEVQGYAWRGLVDTARLARTVWQDPAWADELDELAADLRDRFMDRFWMDDLAFPALALDGAGRQVDALASNAGHLLWSGILDADHATAVADRLLAPEFFTGFGIRTLAAGQALYAPTSYHNGSVWPHDTVLAAVGMEQAGLTAQARTVATGILDAATEFGGRLPELFGGFSTDEFPVPVRYAHAGVPQAWAAAATVAAARLLASRG
ncbi:glycogen debranching N-terminal domain-containing protein [Nocardioides albus]|uniref:Glycogen debranching enzyme n=1 Tax=Nocardioides albus TaxID=1841 RepID=A0A7W5F7A2_9ACTN|nr:glycogen debranching N-terminal domain-containing protein [Nocardioides albus]MBB3087924.1 glycogen debranching enzyme [Nocardioides albus]GGU21339.1 aminotransferase [Nocardioides albus]